MKLKRLFFMAMVPLVAAMGDTPGTEGDQRYIRGEVPAARAEAPAAEKATRELTVLPATEVQPAEFLWQARPLVIFADTAADPAFLMQIKALQDLPKPLIDRDVVVITDTDPAAGSAWRRQLHPRGFSLVIIDKDGQVKQRKPAPWSVREISRAIDKFPLRLEEIGRAGVLP